MVNILQRVGTALAAITIGCVVLGGCKTNQEADMQVDWRFNPQGWQDTRHEFSPEAIGEGLVEHLKLDALYWDLTPSAWENYPARGTWRTGPIDVPGGFTELLPSWNVSAEPQTGLRLQVRVRTSKKRWSPWMEIGRWGDVHQPIGETEFAGGRVAIDLLALTKPAEAYELRATLVSFDLGGRKSPKLYRVVAVASVREGSTSPDDQELHPGERVDLDVPFIPQAEAGESVSGRICSAASTAMVMAFAGDDDPLTVHAAGVYDTEHGIFGNWGRAIAWASQRGLRGELARFRTWRQVRETLESGQPIVASIRFAPGEMPSSVMADTGSEGHLIVIRGLTEQGDAIVNDGASEEHGEAAVYDQRDLARAWLGIGGVGYLIEPSPPATQSAATRSRTPR